MESLGRATAAIVFRGDTQGSSQVVGTSGPTLLWGVARWMTCRLTQSEGISRASVSRTASTCYVLAEVRTDPPRLWMMPVDFGFCKTRTYTSGNVEVLSRGRRSYHPATPTAPSFHSVKKHDPPAASRTSDSWLGMTPCDFFT